MLLHLKRRTADFCLDPISGDLDNQKISSVESASQETDLNTSTESTTPENHLNLLGLSSMPSKRTRKRRRSSDSFHPSETSSKSDGREREVEQITSESMRHLDVNPTGSTSQRNRKYYRARKVKRSDSERKPLVDDIDLLLSKQRPDRGQIYYMDAYEVTVDEVNASEKDLLEILRDRMGQEEWERLGVGMIRIKDFNKRRKPAVQQFLTKKSELGNQPYPKEQISRYAEQHLPAHPKWTRFAEDSSSVTDSTFKACIEEKMQKWHALDRETRNALMDRTSHRRSLDQLSIQTGMRTYPIGHHSDTILRRKEHVRSLLKLPINVYEKCCGKFESLLTSFINEGSITDWAYLIYGTGDKACGHFEDGGLASVNGNLGGHDDKDGKKVWYCVAAKDLGRLLRFFHDNFPYHLADKKCKHAYVLKEFCPTIDALLEAGIDIHVFEQEAGCFVFLNGGTYHIVHSVGFGVAVAKNIITEECMSTYIPLAMQERSSCSRRRDTQCKLFDKNTKQLEYLLQRIQATTRDECLAAEKHTTFRRNFGGPFQEGKPILVGKSLEVGGVKITNEKLPPEPIRKKNTQTKTFVTQTHKFHECPVCFKQFDLRSGYRESGAHLNMHCGVGSLKCIYCGEEFDKSFVRCRHVRELHVAVELTCNECNTSFTSIRPYQKHKKDGCDGSPTSEPEVTRSPKASRRMAKKHTNELCHQIDSKHDGSPEI